MNQTSSERPGIIFGWVFIVCFSLALLYFGFMNAQTALTDPDTCWLVAVGKYIGEHGIPSSDPFSWTLASPPLEALRPYIAYQWLSCLLFNSVNQVAGAAGLTYLTALTVISAYVLVPLIASRPLQISPLVLAIIATTAISAGSFHFPCRPEIFSYLLLSVLIASVVKLSENKGRLPFFVYGLISLAYFALWANLHTGFVLGLIVLAITSLQIRRVPLLAALMGGMAGSLLTPYGTKLWQYLPHLFFSQANKYNQELFPLTTYELLSYDYFAFDLLLIAALAGLVVFVVSQISNRIKHKKFSQETFNHLPWLILALAGFFAALQSRRMVPFAAILVMGFVYQFCLTHRQKLAQWAFPLPLKSIYFFIPVFTVAGVGIASLIFPARLPNTTFGFSAPTQAIELISKTRPAGHLLNDPQYGDVMLLLLGAKAQVFLDTRFDVYGDDITLDFWKMANCRGQWKELLERYQIDWIFFPPRAPIVSRLAQDNAWKKLYSDDIAVILVKEKK